MIRNHSKKEGCIPILFSGFALLAMSCSFVTPSQGQEEQAMIQPPSEEITLEKGSTPENTEEDFLTGVLHFYQNETEEALVHINRSIDTDPDFLEAYLLRGICHLRMSSIDEAKKDFDFYAEREEDKSESFNVIGKLLYAYSFLEEAEIYLKKALTHQPENSMVYSNLGSVLVEQEKYEEALECFTKALEINPSLPEAYVNLGMLYFILEDFSASENAFLHAVQLNQKEGVWDPTVFANLGDLYFVTKELDLCIKSYSIAVNLNPKLSYVRTRLGMAYQLSGEFHLACEQYEKAIAMGGEPPEAHTKLAECLLSHGLIFEAMSEYRKAIQLSDHKDPEPMVALAEILMRMERFNDALFLFREAFEIGERSPRVLALLSWLYECMKLDEESLKYYTLLTDGDMTDPVVLLAIAKRCAESNLHGIKNPAKALGLTRQLMDDMAFKHPAVLEVMASAYASLGDFKKAAEIQRQALAVLPELNPLFTSLKDRLYEFRDKID